MSQLSPDVQAKNIMERDTAILIINKNMLQFQFLLSELHGLWNFMAVYNNDKSAPDLLKPLAALEHCVKNVEKISQVYGKYLNNSFKKDTFLILWRIPSPNFLNCHKI